MPNTIAFFEREYDKNSDKDRLNFHNMLEGKKIPVYHNWESIQNNIPNILFYHGQDVLYLKDSCHFKKQLDNTWRIEFGGNNTEQEKPSGKTISYVNYSELQNRIDEVKDELEKLDEVTAEKLIDIVFGFNSKLEELLKPFESVSPFAKPSDKVMVGEKTNDKDSTVGAAKDALTKFVKDKFNLNP